MFQGGANATPLYFRLHFLTHFRSVVKNSTGLIPEVCHSLIAIGKVVTSEYLKNKSQLDRESGYTLTLQMIPTVRIIVPSRCQVDL